MDSKNLDFIIFGATGYTGTWTVKNAVEVLKDYKWGIAGRSQEKLQNVLKEVGSKVEKDLSAIPIIIADVKNEESLTAMAAKCKVIVNCCGPYRFYGEPVVKACIKSGTHHVDVSGEPQYMETMQLEYNDLAREKGIYIVSACGFDSIPADLGTVFTENHFDGVVNSVETYLETWQSGGNKTGAAINYGTWESAIYGLAHANELSGIRAKLFKSKLPQLQPKLKDRALLHKSNITDKWCLPFPGSDRSVVMRSQRVLLETENKRPVQMRAYIGFQSLIATIAVALFGLIFGMLSRFSFGRTLLLNHPKIFSGGMISHEGPSEEKMDKTKFCMTFVAEGWPKEKKLAEPTDEYCDPPTKTLITKVSGSNPGYGATGLSLLLSGLMILNENNKMPSTGGVFPPGACFAKTSMIEQLKKHEYGFKFEIVSGKETNEE